MKRFCACSICRKFRDDGKWFDRLSKGFCEICKRTDAHLASWVPDLLRTFLGFEQICWACRNGISAWVERWELCWASDSDETIKWALCDWLLGHHFSGHFYPHAYAYMARECCNYGHGIKKVA